MVLVGRAHGPDVLDGLSQVVRVVQRVDDGGVEVRVAVEADALDHDVRGNASRPSARTAAPSSARGAVGASGAPPT